MGMNDTWSGQWRGSYRDRNGKDESEAMDGVEKYLSSPFAE